MATRPRLFDRDAHALARRADLENLARQRRFFFEKIDVRRPNGESHRKTRLDVFFDKLSDLAAGGESVAYSELQKLFRLLQSQQKVPGPAGEGAAHGRAVFAERKEASERAYQRYRAFYWQMYDTLIDSIVAHFKEHHGDLGDVSALYDPRIMSREPLENIRRRRALDHRKKAKGKPYQEGYKKPPKRTQLQTGHKGFQRRNSEEDLALERLKVALSTEKKAVTSERKEVLMRKADLADLKLFSTAMAGKREALAVIRGIILDLHDNDMLAPEPKPDRRTPIERYGQAAYTCFAMTHAEEIKFDLMARFAKRYGEVPPLVTEFEKILTANASKLRDAAHKLSEKLKNDLREAKNDAGKSEPGAK